MSDLPVIVRAICEADKAFVIDSWLNTLAYYSPEHSWAPKRLLRSIYRAQIERLLEHRPELFRVLVNEDDGDQIFGWACLDTAVHFVYVKQDFRRCGVATMLIGVGPWMFSHWTKDCERIKGVEYKPSLFQEVLRGINQVEKDHIPGGRSERPGTTAENTGNGGTGKAGSHEARVQP